MQQSTSNIKHSIIILFFFYFSELSRWRGKLGLRSAPISIVSVYIYGRGGERVKMIKYEVFFQSNLPWYAYCLHKHYMYFTNWDRSEGMNFDHDFGYSFPRFSSPHKKRGKKRRRMN